MRLGDAHIKKPSLLPKGAGKVVESGAVLHRRCDGADAFVALCQLGQIQPEFVGKVGGRRRKGLTGVDVKAGGPVVFARVFLRIAVPLALLCFDVQKDRTVQIFGALQHIAQRFHIVSVDRS